MVQLKNSLRFKNNNYLNLAFEQAKINLGSTKSNPSVGCVVEKNGSIISAAHTSIHGRPHAEFNALNKNIDFKKSNVYITLEPCSHYGLTPPCTDIIKKKKVAKVFFPLIDLDKRSKNKSKSILKRNNILVKRIKNLSSLANDFYKSYLLQYTSKQPLVDSKIAISKDYYTKNLKKKWITNNFSRTRVHLIRSRYNCIISTSKTINADNSLLNCRIKGLENKSPDVVIIDRFLKIKNKLQLFKNIGNRKILVFTTSQNKKKINFLKKKGLKIYILKYLNNSKDYKFFFNELKKLQYSRILVETGLTFVNFLIKNKFLHNLFIFKSNNLLKKNGINYANNSQIRSIRLINRINVNLLGDNLYKIKLK
jgi:diaminohydroxyphosphoribosylaminopyrimidine deaminase/5-amino-6-(5-phosphoribosylamino)uracil reductase